MKKLIYITVAALALAACGTSTTKDNDPWGQIDPGEANKRSSVVEFSMTSSAMNRRMHCQVWLPADYDKSKTYPFLYLLHGYETNDQNGRFDKCWLEKGNASRIADDYQKAGGVPMVIVMPNGLDKFYYSDGYDAYFEEELMKKVEADYHCNGKRAIGGLSMGGYGTILHALEHPSKYTYAYAMSPAASVWWNPSLPEPKDLLSLQTDVSAFPSFTFEVGEQDTTVDNNATKQLCNEMKSKGITCEYISRPGTHYWDFWQGCLTTALIRVGESFK